MGGPPVRRRWELPFRAGFPGDSLCHCARPCIHLVFYAFARKIAKVAENHNSLETEKLVEKRKTDENIFKRNKKQA